MNKNTNLKTIEFNILNKYIGNFPEVMKELFLCFFIQDLNRNSNQVMLDEYSELRDVAVSLEGENK